MVSSRNKLRIQWRPNLPALRRANEPSWLQTSAFIQADQVTSTFQVSSIKLIFLNCCDRDGYLKSTKSSTKISQGNSQSSAHYSLSMFHTEISCDDILQYFTNFGHTNFASIISLRTTAVHSLFIRWFYGPTLYWYSNFVYSGQNTLTLKKTNYNSCELAEF